MTDKSPGHRPRALSHRTVTLHRPQIRPPQPQRAIWSEFESVRPAVLAALAHSVVTALQRIRDIDLANVPRFLDAAYWCAAAAPALGFTEERVVQAITDPTAMWLGSDLLRDEVRTFLPPAAI
jgi:hypothetical protein